jgi:putative transposase
VLEAEMTEALAEIYVQGLSTRKVKAITEELCGHSFSASSISAMNQRLNADLAQFAGRPLAEAYPYLILDARYERVREAGVIVGQPVLIAIGIEGDGRRQSPPRRRPGVLAVERATARADRAGAISCWG